MNLVLEQFQFVCEQVSSIESLVLLTKLTLLLALVLTIHRLLGNRSASLRHGVLVAGLLCVPVFVMVHACVPTWQIPGAQIAKSSLTETYRSTLGVFKTKTLPLFADSIGGAESTADAGLDWAESEYDSDNPFLKPAQSLEPAAATLTGSAESSLSEKAATRWNPFQLISIVILVWLAGATFFVTRIVLAWCIVATNVRRAEDLTLLDERFTTTSTALAALLEQTKAEDIRVKVSCNDEHHSPFGFGMLRRRILLPTSCFSWTYNQWQAVLLHERAHFRRGDLFSNLFARLMHSVLWLHPLSWSLLKNICNECEIACDDWAIKQGAKRADYAEMLFSIAKSSRRDDRGILAAVAMSQRAPCLETRVKSVLSETTPRQPVDRFTLLALFVAMVVCGIPIASAGFQSTPELVEDTESRLVSNEVQDTGVTSSVLVETRAGQKFSGTVGFRLNLEAEFGEVAFGVDSLTSVRRVHNTSDKFRVVSRKGSSVIGTIVQENFELETPTDFSPGAEVRKISFSDVKSISFAQRPQLMGGDIVDGFATNHVSYHVRVPDGFKKEQALPALLILHSARSNSKKYLDSIVTSWPEIGERYVLIGINGEQIATNSNPENPSFNYSFVNFAGKSKYKGFPGTDRESPALIAEVIREIKETVPLSSLFVGGHSQGGYLAFSMMMNYPELVDGAFPISGGLIIQCEPSAFLDEDIRAKQREIPVVVVQSKNAGRFKYSQSEFAYEGMVDDGFPMIGLISDPKAGNRFSRMPIDKAVSWLEEMTSTDPVRLVESVVARYAQRDLRGVVALLDKLQGMNVDQATFEPAARIMDELLVKVREGNDRLLNQVRLNKNGEWIDEFLEFKRNFEHFEEAKPLMDAFQTIRSQHEEPAEKLFFAARKLSQEMKQAEAQQMYEEIVDKYYASTSYLRVKMMLDARE